MYNNEHYKTQRNNTVNIKIIGVGGAGNNAINLLLKDNESFIDKNTLYVANTDAQDLEKSNCENKICLGSEDKRGFGAGGDPEVGKNLTLESSDEIKEILQDTDLLILTGGLGGGTGTGALPVFAKIAKELNVLTLAFVTTPFESVEGKKKKIIATQGIDELKKYVDSYVVISNQKLASNYKDIPFKDSLLKANTLLKNAMRMIYEILNVNGTVNIDFNDLKSILQDGQQSIIVSTKCTGPNKVQQAVEKCLNNTLFDIEIKKCKKLLVNYHLDSKGSIAEMTQAAQLINEHLNVNEDKIFEIVGIIQDELDPNIPQEDHFTINLIASGISDHDINIESENKFSVKESINISSNGVKTNHMDFIFGTEGADLFTSETREMFKDEMNQTPNFIKSFSDDKPSEKSEF
ncbi:UNVERIFIED_CONTAM: cell division protein FtsZ [Campylobacter lari]